MQLLLPAYARSWQYEYDAAIVRQINQVDRRLKLSYLSTSGNENEP
jgi:hypothetical protein